MTGLGSAAEVYAARGWHVFPLTPRSKLPTKGSHGALDATTDTAQIREWWHRWPDANIGISAGKSRLVHIDIDPRHGGEESLHALGVVYGPLPETVKASTPSGGCHFYFAAPDGVTIRQLQAGDNETLGLGPGIDVRSREGGYVVAPPSELDQAGYHWLRSPDDTPVAAMPPWLIRKLAEQPTTRTVGAVPLRYTQPLDLSNLGGIPEGKRDETLFRLAAKLRGAGVSRSMAEQAVLRVAERCSPPFPVNAALDKVASAYNRYQPRAARGGLSGSASGRAHRWGGYPTC